MTYQTIISVEVLNKNINDQDWFIFDCRFLLKDSEGGLKKYNQELLFYSVRYSENN